MRTKKRLLLAFMVFSSMFLFAKDYPAATFGIHSDGITLNTTSIQFAIDHINAEGGGRLVFHAGKYLTGSIYLKSNVTIHLEAGAVLLGVLTPFDYKALKNIPGMILAFDQHDIAVTGKGIIDGQGKYVARNCVANIEKGIVNDYYKYGRAGYTRPMFFSFLDCKNITVKGVTFKNAGNGGQWYEHCSHITVDSIHVENNNYWNEDGFDLIDCDNVSITNSFIDAADDCICLKSHDKKHSCDNFYIANNTVRSGANAIKFGTVSFGGFRNVKIINNTVFNTYRSALALESVDGGFLEDVVVDGLKVFNTGNLIFLRIGERRGKGSTLKNVNISNVYAEIPAGKPDEGYGYEGPIEDLPRNVSPAIIIAGVPGLLVSNVTFENFEIKHPGGAKAFYANVPLDKLNTIPELSANYPEYSMFKELPAWGIFARHATGIIFNNISMTTEKDDFRVPIVLDDVHQSKFSGLKIDAKANKTNIFQNKTTKIEIN